MCAERKRVTLSERASNEKASIVITSQHATSCLSFIRFSQCEYRVISTEMRGVSRYFSNQRLFLASVERRRRRRFVYDVSVCPVGDMDGPNNPKQPKSCQKLTWILYSYNNSPKPVYTSGWVLHNLAFFVIQPGLQMCNFEGV